MALKEYEFGDRTYLFDEDHVPAGAKLVNDKVETGEVVLFPDQVKPEDVPEDKPEDKPEEPKAKTPANKQAKPDNK